MTIEIDCQSPVTKKQRDIKPFDGLRWWCVSFNIQVNLSEQINNTRICEIHVSIQLAIININIFEVLLNNEFLIVSVC